jgi:hypothetical protein
MNKRSRLEEKDFGEILTRLNDLSHLFRCMLLWLSLADFHNFSGTCQKFNSLRRQPNLQRVYQEKRKKNKGQGTYELCVKCRCRFAQGRTLYTCSQCIFWLHFYTSFGSNKEVPSTSFKEWETTPEYLACNLRGNYSLAHKEVEECKKRIQTKNVDQIWIKIEGSWCFSYWVCLPVSTTIWDVRLKITQKEHGPALDEQHSLTRRGSIVRLEDEETLADLGILSGQTFYLSWRPSKKNELT